MIVKGGKMKNTSGVVTFAEVINQPTRAEGRALIAALKKENAQLLAAQTTRQRNSQTVSDSRALNTESAISQLREKIPLVEKRSPNEIDANQKIDAAIQNAVGTWRTKGKDRFNELKTPINTEFTSEELDLAGLIHEYAGQAGLPFKTAMDQIFNFLKRNPKSLENYTNGEVNFAESAGAGASFAVPRGWGVDPQRMEVFRRARVYQAGHPDCEFAEAVSMTGMAG